MKAEAESRNPIDKWLRRFVQLMLIVLLSGLASLVWHLSNLARQANTTFETVSRDLTQVSKTASLLSERIDAAVTRVDELTDKASRSVSFTEVDSILSEINEIREARELRRSPDKKAEDEIDHLIGAVAHSGLRFRSGTFTRSGRFFSIKLRIKFRLYRNMIHSAEDFIKEAATTSINRKPYLVISEKSEEPLDDWLFQILRDYRAAREKEGKG